MVLANHEITAQDLTTDGAMLLAEGLSNCKRFDIMHSSKPELR